jgi:hypothetical protein
VAHHSPKPGGYVDRRGDLSRRRPRRAELDNVWRGPCGAWHYLRDPCATCVALAEAAALLDVPDQPLIRLNDG